MIITRSGILIRLAVKDLRVMGRATQGVRLINLRDEDAIASVAKVEVDESENVEDVNPESIEDSTENEQS
jgi:DNA gyrase subunit A